MNPRNSGEQVLWTISCIQENKPGMDSKKKCYCLKGRGFALSSATCFARRGLRARNPMLQHTTPPHLYDARHSLPRRTRVVHKILLELWKMFQMDSHNTEKALATHFTEFDVSY